MNAAVQLIPEWERINALGGCLAAARSGNEITAEMKSRLHELQRQVISAREESPWREMTARHDLTPVDQDILACAVAPEAEPKVGWMFHELQPWIASPYPTPALLREILFMDIGEAEVFNGRLKNGAPLLASGLLERAGNTPYSPLRPSARALHGLMGWPVEWSAPPGAIEIPVHAAWDDLVVSDDVARGLREFMLWVTHRHIVAGEWRARLGGGPVALFAGPSGTGKTFAAEVLAHTLGWPLFRVDLGLLVSKYIGETEKNLNALFDVAAGRKMVLLFDEADSLFGKRGEVKDARDRYANMEISHLLSRIERHDGPCILTTNLRRHMDAAFSRRFQMVIEFQKPDEKAREHLWRKHLPARAPLDGEVDTALLAASMKLTGGQIRNAALHAAFLAAGDGVPIANRHLARAAWLELSKDGGEILRSSLGPYSDLVNEEVNHED